MKQNIKKVLLSVLFSMVTVLSCNPLEERVNVDYSEYLYQKWFKTYDIKEGQIIRLGLTKIHFEADNILRIMPGNKFLHYKIDGRQISIRNENGGLIGDYCGDWFVIKHVGDDVYLERYQRRLSEIMSISGADSMMIRLVGVSIGEKDFE